MKTLKIKKLTLENLDSMLDLQNKTNDNLKNEEKHFILPKTRKEFYRALVNDEYHIAGVFDDDKLVAQATLGLPKDGKKRELEEYASESKNSEIAIYKTIIVDPEYRSHGIMKKMLEYFETLKEVKERKKAIIQIAIDNPASWINALKNGMAITKVDFDPEDNAKVIYLEKNITKSKQTTPNINTINCDDDKTTSAEEIEEVFASKKTGGHLSDNTYKLKLGNDITKNSNLLFNKMKKLSETMIGVKWNKEDNSIYWQQKKNSNKDVLLLISSGIKNKTFNI